MTWLIDLLCLLEITLQYLFICKYLN
jgi:hypothetical protein